MPEMAMYWSSDAIADVMSKGPFQKLSQYFHLNDNSAAVPKGQPEYDPLFKVHPLLDAIADNSRAHYFPGRDISFNEVTIKFNGRLSFKQYIKGVYWWQKWGFCGENSTDWWWWGGGGINAQVSR